MENKLTEPEIIDYLYGNLSQAEENRIEGILQEDATLRAEVEDLRQLMGLIGQVEDKEVIPPAFVIDANDGEAVSFWDAT